MVYLQTQIGRADLVNQIDRKKLNVLIKASYSRKGSIAAGNAIRVDWRALNTVALQLLRSNRVAGSKCLVDLRDFR